MFNPFVVVSVNSRHILYVRTPKTYECLCAVSDREKVFNALRNFLAGTRTQEQLMMKVNAYESMNTKAGLIFKKYNTEFLEKNINDEWEDTLNDFLSERYKPRNNKPFTKSKKLKFARR